MVVSSSRPREAEDVETVGQLKLVLIPTVRHGINFDRPAFFIYYSYSRGRIFAYRYFPDCWRENLVDLGSPICGKNCGILETAIPNVGMRRGRGEENFRDRGISGYFQYIQYLKSRQNIQTNRMKGLSTFYSVYSIYRR